MTPATVADATYTLNDMEWLPEMVDATLPKFGPRGSNKKLDAEILK